MLRRLRLPFHSKVRAEGDPYLAAASGPTAIPPSGSISSSAWLALSGLIGFCLRRRTSSTSRSLVATHKTSSDAAAAQPLPS
ncbi:MAG: MprA protease, GlyGly-CTERM protein-sorting domain-containing form [Flavobacteriaceae bacterium]|nr:MprA protease, GlyGly-CTERM protein-sorting domain-containing form [Flavobacteriaceae bacterium]